MSWFDYRPLPDELRNLHFLKEWAARYVRWMGECGLDISFDEKGNEIKVGLPYGTMEQIMADEDFWGGMIRLRKFADRYEMPYSDLWRYVFKVVTDDDEYGPYMRHFLDVGMRNAVVEMHNDNKEAHLILSSSELFLAENFAEQPVQFDYRNYLVAEVTRRHPNNKEIYLQDLVDRGQLPADFMEKQNA